MRTGYTQLLGIALALAGFLSPFLAQSQCANNNTFWTSVGNINPGQTVTVTGTWGGEYNTFNCVNGATYVISTCNGGTWDSQLTLYNNTGGSALAFNDDFCGLQSQITWTATFNGTVRVLLDRFNCSSINSPMTMTITRNGGGGNCWDGVITGTGSVSSTTCNAGNESSLRSSPDRIYRVNIQSPGCYNFSLCGSSSSWDSYLYLTTDCPGNTSGGGTVLAQSDDACGLLSQINNVTLATGIYYITVEGFGSFDCGNFNLNISNATSIAPSAGIISAQGAFGCGSIATFSVPFQSGITYNWSSSNGSIIGGQGTNSVSIAWGNGQGTVSVIPTNSCGTQGAASSLVATCTPAPSNDDCSNAIAFTGNQQSFSNQFATGSDISSCGFNDFRDVWYSWTAPSCGQVTFSTVCGASFDTHLSLYSSCGGTQLACNDDAFDYSCNYGLTSRITANVTAGQSYLLRISGYNGAQGSGTVFMSMSTPLNASAIAGSILCNGGSTAVNVAASGGSGIYSGTGSFTANSGIFNYTVSDSYGCSVSGSLNIVEPTPLIADAVIGNPINCFGENGTILVSASGGIAPYNGTGLYEVSAGIYSYSISDANGCSATVEISLSQPDELLATAEVSELINCNGETGVINVSATGGTPDYLGTGDNIVTAGTYSFTVTDQNGCTAETTATITEPAPLLLDAGMDQLTYFGYQPEECFTSTAFVNGGEPSYTFEWTANGEVVSSAAMIVACPEESAVYNVTVTDDNGCSVSDEIWVCVVNVVCQAGNSNNFKVEMCQVPPGNPNNAHTICVDASAVPAHLAIGCSLGSCDELEQVCGAANQISTNGGSNTKSIEIKPSLAFTAMPNPTENYTTVSLTPVHQGQYSVMLTDMTGRTIAELFNGTIGEYENVSFDVLLSTLNTGVYMISVSGSNGSFDQLRVVKK
jgi:hypothetical protein